MTITITVLSDVTDVQQYDHDVMLNSNPSFQNRNKIKRNLDLHFVSLIYSLKGFKVWEVR